jgi:hypothetical protein
MLGATTACSYDAIELGPPPLLELTREVVVGDLVKIRPTVQPGCLYGLGLVLDSVEGRLLVKWKNHTGNCGSYAVEVVNEDR